MEDLDLKKLILLAKKTVEVRGLEEKDVERDFLFTTEEDFGLVQNIYDTEQDNPFLGDVVRDALYIVESFDSYIKRPLEEKLVLMLIIAAINDIEKSSKSTIIITDSFESIITTMNSLAEQKRKKILIEQGE